MRRERALGGLLVAIARVGLVLHPAAAADDWSNIDPHHAISFTEHHELVTEIHRRQLTLHQHYLDRPVEDSNLPLRLALGQADAAPWSSEGENQREEDARLGNLGGDSLPSVKAGFRLDISPVVWDKSVNYQMVHAVGFELSGNRHTTGERVVVLGPEETVITTLSMPATAAFPDTSFVAVISTSPVMGLIFEGFAGDEDEVLLKSLVFGTRDAGLLEELPPSSSTLFYTAFNGFVIAMIMLDLVLMGKKVATLSSALWWSLAWISLALSFGYFGVFMYRGRGPAAIWITAYVLEKSLSVDNLFVFVTIFTTFKTPVRFQHKALTWGIASAILLRAIFIFGGVLVINKFQWLLAACGLFLIYAGIKAIIECWHEHGEGGGMTAEQVAAAAKMDGSEMDEPINVENVTSLRMLSKCIPITQGYDGRGRFFVTEARSSKGRGLLPRHSNAGFDGLTLPGKPILLTPVSKGGLCKATPLFAVLLVIETTDLIFAADSIPAVLSITDDAAIAYTSNIFAVLGLRALYFALSALMKQFAYLGGGLGVILIFIGVKLLLAFTAEVHLTVELTLSVVLGVLAASVVGSMYCRR